MSMSGTWVLHFSWSCTLSYSSVDITFNNDGTLTGPGPGQWRQQDGTLMLSWDRGPAKYSGTVDGNAASGAMTTFDGSPNGCWYLLREGTVRSLEEEERVPTHDAMGNPALDE